MPEPELASSAADPWAILGVAPGAAEEELRAAYLARIRQHPPDTSPREFERVRDAYAALRDPRRRARLVLEGDDPQASFASLLDGLPPRRLRVGPRPWRRVLEEG